MMQGGHPAVITETNAAADPVDALVHDHSHLSALLLDLRATSTRLAAGEVAADEAVPELAHAAEVLHDALVEHFAREEEALFPYIEEELASIAPRSRAVRADHDVVCGRAAALAALLRSGGDAAALGRFEAALAELERVYAAHSLAEIDLLREVDAALDRPRRAALAALLAGL